MSSNPKPYNGLPKGVDRDPDQINSVLWKRKLYKKRIARNENKRLQKAYRREKQEIEEKGGVIVPTDEAQQALELDPKKQELYAKIFAPDPAVPEEKKTKRDKQKPKSEIDQKTS